MKTKITIVTGEEFILEGNVGDFVNNLTNQLGVFITKIVKVNTETFINTSHIVKIERVED